MVNELFCWVEKLAFMALQAVNGEKELVVEVFHAVMQYDLCNGPV